MIGIAEDDKKYLKFLWYPNDDSEDFKIMQMNRVVFGCNCSPFLLSATIKYHIGKYSETNKSCFEMLNGSLYADDLCHGADDVESAFNLSSDAVSILSDASFNLRKLHTNSKQLHDLWIQNGLCEENSFQKDNKLKALGLVWNLEEDMLRVDVASLLESFKFLENTKRSVLSTAAKVFDPVGFLSPFVVRITRLMQEIWERGLDWDSKLPEDLESKWKKWCAEIEVLGEMKTERCYFSRVVGKMDSVEIHIFSDASIVAYGAVAYFRYVNLRGEVGTSFVMSKSRISPLKKLSLPRLELMGALIAARLWKYLSKVFCGLVDGVFLWTDSEICLCWIKGSAREWKQFVSNRVLEIQDCTSPDRWKFCPGLENPADKLTRGENSHTLLNDSVWWQGPVWLRGSRNQWPRQKFERVTDEQKLEKLNTSVHAILPQTEIILDENKFSNLGKLLRVTAWVKRFVAKLRKKTCESGTLSAAEIKEAEEYWVRRVQLENYCSDINLLKKNKPVPPHSKIYSLVPYVDDRGILRVKGRLEQAELFHNEKHPAILPKSKFTDLIIMSEHVKSFHSRVVSTLSRVRNNFWIPRGRQVVKKVISECLICKKCALKPAKQLTGQLPRDRVVESPPFAVVGIDFTGAITIKAGDQSCKKVYIALFTCAVTRAVHIEVVSDMSVKSFIFALRRFLSRRGGCKVIYSDNAKSFRCACEIIKGFKKIIVDPSVQEFISSKGVTWKFIPERAPWWGGFWERLMKSIKDPLRKILGKALLTFEELITIMTELECVLNNRPITYETNELGEPRCLTPSLFLLPGRDNSLPEHFLEIFNKVVDRETLTRRKLYQSRLLKQLWTKWKDQYLLQLRTAHNFTNPSSERNLKSGDIVLVEGPKKSKLLWDMGVVEKVIVGRDGHVRACIVRTPKGQLRRAVQLLYPFEI
ncbi:hypothetical protein CDAR_245561 [Caerostris darwini]|uniref:Integrase catalytic domain-containing protein n=1 Tax=Caerostris darwini TaxID=1538125 RepID=A0AAV4P144_9ARAC|nr:hypothetical protein CDAR_245241 [Caerostris darwini]GIX89822.1 hypothetical protein CDAR_245561 [Caerostris darwini]